MPLLVKGTSGTEYLYSIDICGAVSSHSFNIFMTLNTKFHGFEYIRPLVAHNLKVTMDPEYDGLTLTGAWEDTRMMNTLEDDMWSDDSFKWHRRQTS